ncbi:MAG: hypothetical protein Q8N56_02280 [bacterium]|nr:hypothetical protein [bacterium]
MEAINMEVGKKYTWTDDRGAKIRVEVLRSFSTYFDVRILSFPDGAGYEIGQEVQVYAMSLSRPGK